MRYAAAESLVGAADAIRSTEAARVHHATRRRDSRLAARGAGTAADRPNRQNAPTRDADAWDRRAFGSYSRSILPWTARTWLRRGEELGPRAPRWGLEFGPAPRAGGRTGRTESRYPCRVEHDDGPCSQASDELDPHRRSGHGRSCWRRAGRQPGTAWR